MADGFTIKKSTKSFVPALDYHAASLFSAYLSDILTHARLLR